MAGFSAALIVQWKKIEATMC